MKQYSEQPDNYTWVDKSPVFDFVLKFLFASCGISVVLLKLKINPIMLLVPFVQTNPIWTVVIVLLLAGGALLIYEWRIAPMLRYDSSKGDELPLDDHEIKIGG